MVSLCQESKAQQRQQWQLGQAVGRVGTVGGRQGRAGQSVAAEGQRATSKDVLKKEERLQQQQWDRKSN